MPDLKLMYLVNNVGNGSQFLSDSMEFVPVVPGGKKEPGAPDPMQPLLSYGVTLEGTMPREVLVCGLGHYGNRPLMFIRLDREILIYAAFRYGKGHLKVRFRRMENDLIYCPRFKSEFEDISEETDRYRVSEKNVSKLRYFKNVTGMPGVAVCGEQSCFIFLTHRGELRIHRLYANKSMKTFAAFNNINCPNGFLYFDHEYELQICVFPTYLTYDCHWPVRKIPMRCTPAHVTFHREHKVYGVVLNHQDASNKFFRFNGEDKEIIEENKGERFLYPTVDKFEVVLVSPETWEIVPETSIELDEWEHVISFKNVSLVYEGAMSGLKEYIAVGTNYTYSEDITSRGRVSLAFLKFSFFQVTNFYFSRFSSMTSLK